MNKRLIITSLISIILICILFISSTYSIFTSEEVDDNVNVYTTGNLDITYTVSDDSVKLTDSLPRSEDEKYDVVPYRVTVTNVGNVAYKFNLILNDVTATNGIDHNYIMVEVGNLDSISLGSTTDGIIKSDIVVEAAASVDIDIRIYISDSIPNSEIGNNFNATLTIDGIAVYNNTGEINNSELIANNYCSSVGITKLSDCLLISSTYVTSVDSAKTIISKKEADFTQTAPVMNYTEKIEKSVTGTSIFSTTTKVYFGTGYTFDTSTGMYTLTNYSLDYVTNKLSGSSVYYTCGYYWVGNCATMYVVYEATTTTSSSSTTYKATKVDRYTSTSTITNESGVGLYAADDDDGTSYYYRGSVTNNYVSYAGFIWRIIRINGDGSIRMIYSGTSTTSTGSNTSIGTSAYNSKYEDITYGGYVYGENLVYRDTTSDITYNDMKTTSMYYFSDSFSCDTNPCTLGSNKISGTWEDNYEQILGTGDYDGETPYKYTCFSTSSTGTCQAIKEITGTNSSTSLPKVKYHGWYSKNYDSISTDENSSTIKEYIDDWYYENILNVSDGRGYTYDEYLADTIFCSDRSIESDSSFDNFANETAGTYVTSNTYFASHYRNSSSNQTPSLICSREEDQLTVSNGKLTYPVALITIDEAAMAGGKYGVINSQFYLYSGSNYWMMSPGYFNPAYDTVRNSYIHRDGLLSFTFVYNSYTIRPVVNLNADIQIKEGNGTANFPYELQINQS